jgi:hypothetical protein
MSVASADPRNGEFRGGDSRGGDLLDRDLNDILRMELGWDEVGKGLGRILFGYGVWIFGTIVGVMLALFPLVELGSKLKPERMSIGHLWYVYAGLGLLSVSSILAQILILAGQWKCCLNASERGWARWWMFICLVTLAMGPAMSLGSQLGGLQRAPELARGAAALHQMKYTTVGVVLQVTSYGMGMLYVIAFCLFLQAAAQCMQSRQHVTMVNLFLAFFVPLSCVTGYLTVRLTVDPTQITKMVKPLAFVGIGWAASLFLWLIMIALVRSCIIKTMKRVRNPMEYSLLEAPAAPRSRWASPA